MAQVPLSKVLPAMDRKDRDFYDNLPEDEKKGFSGYLAMRWLSYAQGNQDLEQYCLLSTNARANKNMFDLSRHKKLQWLMITAASPGIGKVNYKWIKGQKKVKKASDDIYKQLLELFPSMKEDDADVLSQLLTKKELKEYVKSLGQQ